MLDLCRTGGWIAGALLCCMAVCGCASAVPEKRSGGAEEAGPGVSDRVYGRAAFIGAVMDFVHKQYADPEKADMEKMTSGALKGMLQTLDPYSTYISPDELSRRRTQLTGDGVGVGLTVSYHPRQGLLIVGVVPRSPAAEAGIKTGDLIVEVDGHRVREMDQEEFLNRLKGVPGSEVLLSIRRPGTDAPTLYRLTRKAFILNPVPHQAFRRFPHGVGYCRIERFNRYTEPGLLAAVRQLRQQGPLNGLILDLRNNPGGMVDAAVALVSHFLDRDQTVFTSSGRDADKITTIRTLAGKQAFTGLPLVVLVNAHSASASEIMAGALKDHRRAVIVGSRTFGKGAIQEVRMLPNGGAIRYTRAHYRTPGGRKIDGAGVLPDVQVNLSEAEEAALIRAWSSRKPVADPVLEKAVALLQEKVKK